MAIFRFYFFWFFLYSVFLIFHRRKLLYFPLTGKKHYVLLYMAAITIV